jgi:HD-GYP domain-containing protein (c-di-GMP phosphodiesterase class II)
MPKRVSDVEMPLSSGIIAVCNAFDAMISNRPYEPQRASSDELRRGRRCAGTEVDPHIVSVFEQVLAHRASTPITLTHTTSPAGNSLQSG